MAEDCLGSVLRSGLCLMFQEQRYTDVVIEVQNQTFHCHKVILAAVSGFFNAMFSSNMKEASNNYVHLQDLKSEVFNQFLAYLYGNESTIDEKNVEDMFALSSLLQVSSLQAHCEKYMSEQLDISNCLAIWQLAKLYSNPSLEKISFQFILQKFQDVAFSEDIQRLSAEELSQIVSHDDLRVINEEQVCQCVLYWFKGDIDNKKTKLPEVMKHLRLSQVSLNFILNEIDTLPYVHEDPKCLEIMRNGIKYHSLSAKRQDFNALREPFRVNSNYDNFLVLLGQRTKLNGDSVFEFLAYSQSQGSWFNINQIPFRVGEEFATCCYGDNLIITGGTKELDICVSFSSKSGKWSKRSNLQRGRYRHSMVAVGEGIFVLGGYNFGTLPSVEEYDIFNDEWTTVGELALPVDAAAAAVLDSNIYLFGGWLGCAEDTAVIQEFNTVSYTCTKVSNLPYPTRFARALTVEKRIEIVTADGILFNYEPSYDPKKVNQVQNFYRQNFGILRIGDTMHILGGVDPRFTDVSNENGFCRKSFKIQDQKKVERDLEIPAKMEIHGCYILPLTKSHLNGNASQQLEFDQ